MSKSFSFPKGNNLAKLLSILSFICLIIGMIIPYEHIIYKLDDTFYSLNFFEAIKYSCSFWIILMFSMYSVALVLSFLEKRILTFCFSTCALFACLIETVLHLWKRNTPGPFVICIAILIMFASGIITLVSNPQKT